MARIFAFAALLAIGLGLTACGKYEAWRWVDNNCSGNGGFYNADFCSQFAASKQPQQQ